MAREAPDTVDRDLARFQRDEAMVWRLGSIVLLLAAAFGAAVVLGVLMLLVRWWDVARPPPDVHAVDLP